MEDFCVRSINSLQIVELGWTRLQSFSPSLRMSDSVKTGKLLRKNKEMRFRQRKCAAIAHQPHCHLRGYYHLFSVL